jgi:hypothetical protein
LPFYKELLTVLGHYTRFYTRHPSGAFNRAKRKTKTQKAISRFPFVSTCVRPVGQEDPGKLHYFGADPDAALAKYTSQRDDLQAGRIPHAQRDGLTIRQLVNKSLTSKWLLVNSGELTLRSWRDYYVCCERLVDVFGKTRLVIDLGAADFDRLKADLGKNGNSPITVGNEVHRI